MTPPALRQRTGTVMRLLDLFCGAGGASVGYTRAGFEVVGVDIHPMPNYPFEFHQADALDYLREHGHEFDVVHASPPCQGYSRTRHLPWVKAAGKIHPMLIDPIRELLLQLTIPWVIENVADAPLDGIALTGGMFGLPYRRERLFESNILLLSPSRIKMQTGIPGSMFGDRLRVQQQRMGCDWMTRTEASQAIPPAYTEYLGAQLMRYVVAASTEVQP